MRILIIVTLTSAFSLRAMALPACGFAAHSHEYRSERIATDNTRPASHEFVDLKGLSVRLHWVEGIDQVYRDKIAAAIAATWQVEFGRMGFLPPHPDAGLGGSDAFDVYIVDDLKPGIGGYAGFSGFHEPTPRADAFGYLVLSHVIPDHVIGFVVAHELFHASQMAYDWFEDIAWMEASATWITEAVFPDDDIYAKFLPYFQRQPELSVDYVSIMNPYQYGAAMWPMFLEERHGDETGSLIRAIWEGSIQDGYDNEPDYFDSIAEQLGTRGVSFNQAFAEFSAWRVQTGEYAEYGGFRERQLWTDAVPQFLLDTSTKVGDVRFDLVDAIQPYGVGYMRVRRARQGEVTVILTLATDAEVQFQVDALLIGSAGISRIESVAQFAGPASSEARLTMKADVEDVVFIIQNLAHDGFDSDLSPWDAASLAGGISVQR